MKVRELRKILETVDQEAEIVIEGFDHEYRRVAPWAAQAEEDDGHLYDPGGLVPTVPVLIFR